ncbi:MAG: 4-hydroxythreonine-4-phosphate dehydrogenase PdxA [Planctomycetota bacterium]
MKAMGNQVEKNPGASPPRPRPRVAITLGDVAGIGPELVVKGWSNAELHDLCTPTVIGDPEFLRRAASDLGTPCDVVEIREVGLADPSSGVIPCLRASTTRLDHVTPGKCDAHAGRAAYDYLVQGIDLALAGRVDAIVTMPLNKEGLHSAGLNYPGHTEILAERTGTSRYGMMLYRRGLGVVHVTLHMALRDIFRAISIPAIEEKIQLIDRMLRRLGVDRPRLAVAALNPHAGDGGIFGDEEATLIAPAVDRARAEGLEVVGPLPADTLFVRAREGAFDGVVAMYHDQGHIALKLLGWREAVNITVGLPIVRTSVAHGTGYDIVGKGIADPTSFFEATRVAVQLASSAAGTP